MNPKSSKRLLALTHALRDHSIKCRIDRIVLAFYFRASTYYLFQRMTLSRKLAKSSLQDTWDPAVSLVIPDASEG